MGRGVVAAVCEAFVILAMSGQAMAQTSTLDACLVLSPKLSLEPRSTATVMEEIRTIWTPLGVAMRAIVEPDDSCARIVVVESDAEARPEDVADANALGWVPFVKGNARQLVFMRPGRARLLVHSLSPGKRPEGLTEFVLAKLMGRTLAHELGHVLMNSMHHEKSGLMQAQFRAADVLRWPAASYTLNPAERARLFTQLSTSARRAAQ